MSLETQIASLVTASNNLTAAINGKITEINAKVKQATDSVPSVVRGLSRQVFYIDAIDGDDNNDGKTLARAFKTTAGAQAHAVNGSVVELRFRGGQVHYVDLFFELGRIVCTTTGIDTSADDSQRATLRPSPVLSSDGGYTVRGLGVTWGTVYLTNVNVECHTDVVGNISGDSGFIRYTNSNVSVVFRNVTLRLGNLPFARVYLGYAQRDLAMSAIRINGIPGYEDTAQLIGYGTAANDSSTIRLEARSVSMTGITGGWRQLCQTRNADNYHTNLVPWS